jgi:hypothetical protein
LHGKTGQGDLIMATKRRRRKPTEETWWLRVHGGAATYCFAKNSRYGKGEGLKFHEHQDLEMDAEVIEPARFKGRRVELTVSGSRELTRGLNELWQRHMDYEGFIGDLYMRGKQSQVFLYVPHDVLPHLLASFTSTQPTDILLTAEPLVRGNGRVLSMHFGCDYEKDLAIESAYKAAT